MDSSLHSLFDKLRGTLEANCAGLRVSQKALDHCALEAAPGPATLRAWRGEVRQAQIPVAWIELRRDYVSFHLMSVTHPAVRQLMSKQLKNRLQGKTCFHLKAGDEALIRELQELTARGVAAFRDAGFIASGVSGRGDR